MYFSPRFFFEFSQYICILVLKYTKLPDSVAVKCLKNAFRASWNFLKYQFLTLPLSVR